MTQRFLARPVMWAALLLVLAAAAIAYYGNALATKTYLDQATSRGQTTLRLAVAVLRGQMSRYQSLPALIADHYDIQALLGRTGAFGEEKDVHLAPKSESMCFKLAVTYFRKSPLVGGPST